MKTTTTKQQKKTLNVNLMLFGTNSDKTAEMRPPCWSIQALLRTACSFRSSSMTSYLFIHKGCWQAMECIEILRPTENSVRQSLTRWTSKMSRNLCDLAAAQGWKSHSAHSSLGHKSLRQKHLLNIPPRWQNAWACLIVAEVQVSMSTHFVPHFSAGLWMPSTTRNVRHLLFLQRPHRRWRTVVPTARLTSGKPGKQARNPW